jgi:hypothetical protein
VAAASANAPVTDLVVRPGEADVPMTDLVLRLTGPWRRLGDEHLPHTDSRVIREWMLMIGIRQLSRMLRPESPSLDVAERLLSLLLNDDRSAVHVVWLTETHYVACDDSFLALQSNDDPFWRVTLHCEELRTYVLQLWGAASGVRPDPDVLRVLHRLIGLSTVVQCANVEINEARFPDMLPGIDDFVSMARSRRTVKFRSDVSAATGRAVAFNCNPLVSLETNLYEWNGYGAALVEAMLANRCPAVLNLPDISEELKFSLAAAIKVTTSLEDIKLKLPSMFRDAAIFEAIGRNKSIRVLDVFTDYHSDEATQVNETRTLVKVFQCTSITSITVTTARPERNCRFYDERVRQECAELVAKHIRNNTRITSLCCEGISYNWRVMENSVLPVVRWNRFRPIVNGLLTCSGTVEGRVSALLGSLLVRRHLELLYPLLETNHEILLPSSRT